MKKLLCVLIIAILIIFSSCGAKITEGDIYQKEFRPEHTQVMILPLVISNGQTSSVIMIPYIIHYPDRYVIFIKQYSTKENKWITEDYFVSKEVYSGVSIGDHFKFDENMGTDDEPYTKTRQEK